jgi:putative lipoprotein
MIHRLAVSVGCLAALALSACAMSPPSPTPAPTGAEAPADPKREDPTPPAQTQVTGTVFYMERIALTPEAVVHVEVVEVGSGSVIGEQTLRAPGQVPIRFSVPVPSERIRPEAQYAVRARITDGGRLFTTSEPVPVLTQGHPSQDVQVRVRLGG